MTQKTEDALFAIDVATRTVRGLVAPYGELSRPAAAAGIKTEPVRFERGDLVIPDPIVVTLNEQHDRFAPRGRASHLIDSTTPNGVVGAFSIATGPEGDKILADYAAGKRFRLSPEVRGLRRDADDPTRGYATLVGVALVEEGAFASAGLFSIDEEKAIEDDTPELVEDDEDTKTTDTTTEVDEEPEPPAEPKEDDVTVATVPGAFRAAPKADEPIQLDANALFSAIAKARSTGDFAELEQFDKANGLFALNDIKISGSGQVGTVVAQPAWAGQLWSGRRFARKIIPLISQGPLLALDTKAWKWNQKPEVATWAGNKADVPSNTPTVTAYTVGTQRFAGGHDIAREFYDFNVTEVLDAYIAAMIDSYAIKSDAYALAQLLAGATSAVVGTIPAGVGDGIAKIVRGALRVIAADAVPSFAIVAPDVFESIMFTKQDDVLAYLNMSLGLEEGQLENFRIVPSTGVTAGNVLVGAKEAATALELPGSPIRVNAIDIARGGIDEALFGYIGVKIDYPTGLQLVTPNA